MLASTGIILSKEDLDDIMLEFDEDGNGTIEFEEFVQIFVKIMQPPESSSSDDGRGLFGREKSECSHLHDSDANKEGIMFEAASISDDESKSSQYSWKDRAKKL